MKYSKIPMYRRQISTIELYARLKSEYGAKGIERILSKTEKALDTSIKDIKKLPVDSAVSAKEPDNLSMIRKLRPPGPRRIWSQFNETEYPKRIEGALIGRMAGCTLGAPVEAWSIEDMQALAVENKDSFPPQDYWTYVPFPARKRYRMSRHDEYTRKGMDGVPVDDDIIYTLLGLLIAEEYGPCFTTEDVAAAWKRYVPYAYCAGQTALNNINAGCPAHRVGATENPYCQALGGSIRADPWGYMAPGWPERAADAAYRDAFFSHRRNGVYGAMFWAAAISAAFTVADPIKAVRIGLTEIPKDCALAKAVRWALRIAPRIRDYRDAREAVDRRFGGMDLVHTVNNACLTIWGMTIGATDFSKVIGEAVAMGLDNDCTAATAGSIVGAVVGTDGIPKKWYAHFNNRVHSYLNGKRQFAISGLLRRFTKQARIVYEELS